MKREDRRFLIPDYLFFFFIFLFFIFGSSFGAVFSADVSVVLSFSAKTDLLSAFLDCVLFPLLSLLLGHYLFGFILLPFLAFICGFLSAFVSAVLISNGLSVRSILLLFSVIFSSAAFIFLSSYSFSYSFSLFRASVLRKRDPILFFGKRFTRFAVSFLLLVVSFAFRLAFSLLFSI